jgi:class 3 adenylate cyclase
LSAGQPIEDRGDLFGLAVSRAQRICSVAGGGEVVVGAEVLPVAGGDHLRFVRPIDVELKGLPEPQRVLLAQRVPSG